MVVSFMSKDESEDNPQIKEVLKALNHTKRRDILVYLKDLERPTAFSELMEYLSIDSKTSGQFSYHLKLLLKAHLIEKEGDKYRISVLGVKACSMLDMVDTTEKEESLVQKIANSYKNITPLDQVIISFQAFALILFFVPISYILEDHNLLAVLFIPMVVGLLVLGFITLYSYTKLKYIPSILVLSSLIWIIFLNDDQLKTGFVYIISVFGLIFLFQTAKMSSSSNLFLLNILLGVACLVASSLTALYMLYKIYWKKEVNQ